MSEFAGSVEKLLRALGLDPRRSGHEWVARCPNAEGHPRGDRNPSWRMVDEPGGYRHGSHLCWPCGFKGGPAELVMHVRGYMEIGSALAWLGDWQAANPPEVMPAQLPVALVCRPAAARPVFRLPPEVALEPLDAWPAAARRYAQDRGLTAAQVAAWGLGYAVYGRLAGRLVLPARDRHCHARNYTGRSFTGETLRYLSASREEGPDWGCLFGEQHWPEVRVQVAVTEGALNALCVARAMPGMAVAALSGSQLHPVHAVKLATFARVYLVTDPDMAGDTTAAALARALARRVTVIRVKLPPGRDALDVGEAGVVQALERGEPWERAPNHPI